MNQEKKTFSKKERLCKRELIESLFSDPSKGHIHEPPFRLIWKKFDAVSDYPAQIIFIIPRKNIHKAVIRNTLKRKMREGYRIRKHTLYAVLNSLNLRILIACIYSGKDPKLKDFAIAKYHLLFDILERTLINQKKCTVNPDK
jgi:ribonuclease P protein component